MKEETRKFIFYLKDVEIVAEGCVDSLNVKKVIDYGVGILVVSRYLTGDEIISQDYVYVGNNPYYFDELKILPRTLKDTTITIPSDSEAVFYIYSNGCFITAYTDGEYAHINTIPKSIVSLLLELSKR